MNKVFISIDWDYFVPEKLEWDFGHQEKRLFLDFIWKTRFNVFHSMRTNGLETNFWKALKKHYVLTPPMVDVSDSHVDAWDCNGLHYADILILVDRHHDVYTKPKDSNIDCGNWVWQWLNGDRKRRVYWLAPPDVISTDMPEEMKKRFVIFKGDPSDMPVLKSIVVGLHICRSGCWTPPWLDSAFKRFVDESGKLPNSHRLEWSDPLKPRWTMNDFRNARLAERERQTAFASLKQGAITI
jgi:hypothetical protein